MERNSKKSGHLQFPSCFDPGILITRIPHITTARFNFTAIYSMESTYGKQSKNPECLIVGWAV